ncbi:Endopolyphosphatase [Pseudovirgaria hyperparasitica]|uniref:Endopolyphosphatase n=1 Tax=Pseudovirgaria hyperparasitica TaxID=470096 RepID=A0A6A6WHL1_9PEZI|nr:Endopolyphosphatase [Pseudovirgaria hyperparasitica]KAF2761719.1 Endopolyphosphatase [Pseudovirgaria hyperparasitica]
MRILNQLPLELLLLVPALLGQPAQALSVPRFGPGTTAAAAHATTGFGGGGGVDGGISRSVTGKRKKKLHGRFLHITDFHPDPFYKTYAATDAEGTCHRGNGSAGYYGAETSSCDSPISLVNATFDWIDKNIKDEVDFVIWTGDSARHDNDEKLPRSTESVVEQNQLLVAKFLEVFGRKHHDGGDDYPRNALEIPVVPNIGNNDILPHNIFTEGPNFWTNKYLDVWRSFIPEEQRHQFQRGGWFYVEAIPNRLAIFSMNTMYFFASNSAVDGCAAKSEPGYEQFEWLRIQLQFMRERGMKAILIGHVPPARTENKESWEETCWQKYTLWMQQYRDVIIASMYGHMNIAHFMLQDFSEIRPDVLDGRMDPLSTQREFLGDEIKINSATDYLLDLRDEWSKLPTPPSAKSEALDVDDEMECDGEDSTAWSWRKLATWLGVGKNKKHGKAHGGGRHAAYRDKIGGKWGERYSVTHVQASVVPNYFPTMRIFSYNTSGLEHADSPVVRGRYLQQQTVLAGANEVESETDDDDDDLDAQKKKKKKKYKFTVPHPPSKHSPPGPAYSPQPLSLLGYTQFFANLTHINNDFTTPSDNEDDVSDFSGLENGAAQDVDGQRWKPGKHHGKHPHKHKDQEPHPNEFKYEVEYSTFDDKEFGLKDLTVRSYVKLARKIGAYRSAGETDVSQEEYEGRDENDEEGDVVGGEVDAEKKHKNKKKKKKHEKRKHKTKQWLAFVRRAFVETVDPASVESVGVSEGDV